MASVLPEIAKSNGTGEHAKPLEPANAAAPRPDVLATAEMRALADCCGLTATCSEDLCWIRACISTRRRSRQTLIERYRAATLKSGITSRPPRILDQCHGQRWAIWPFPAALNLNSYKPGSERSRIALRRFESFPIKVHGLSPEVRLVNRVSRCCQLGSAKTLPGQKAKLTTQKQCKRAVLVLAPTLSVQQVHLSRSSSSFFSTLSLSLSHYALFFFRVEGSGRNKKKHLAVSSNM
jgi:hypothetical protein